MAERECRYTIDFFTGSILHSDQNIKVSSILVRLIDSGCQPIVGSSFDIEVRSLGYLQDGVIKGVYTKIRKDQIPHAGRAGHGERELDLEQNEGLLEKNHFIYFIEDELLLMQANRNAGTAVALGRYLSDIQNVAISFNPVLQPDAMRRLLRDDLTPVEFEASFSRPTNPEMYPSDDWSPALMNLLGDANAGDARITIKPSLGERRAGIGALSDNIRRAAQELKGMPGIRVLRMSMQDDQGIEYPIDLIADRLKATVDLRISGRYPVEASMFRALLGAKNDQSENLRQIFSSRDHAII